MSQSLYSGRQYNKNWNRLMVIFLIFSIIFIFIVIRWVSSFFHPSTYLFWSAIAIVYSLFGFSFLKYLDDRHNRNEDTWGRGYDAEEVVATGLAALGPDYKLVHDVSKGLNRGNIDHLLIGPTGLFAIETKSNRNRMIAFNFKGKDFLGSLARDFIRQAARNAYWAHQFIKDQAGLDIYAQGLVIRPFNRDQILPSNAPNQVPILDGRSFENYIKNNDRRLSAEEINKIFDLFRNHKRRTDADRR